MEVLTQGEPLRVIVALGDSITEGVHLLQMLTIVGRIYSLNDFVENIPPIRSPFSMRELLAIKY